MHIYNFFLSDWSFWACFTSNKFLILFTITIFNSVYFVGIIFGQTNKLVKQIKVYQKSVANWYCLRIITVKFILSCQTWDILTSILIMVSSSWVSRDLGWLILCLLLITRLFLVFSGIKNVFLIQFLILKLWKCRSNCQAQMWQMTMKK